MELGYKQYLKDTILIPNDGYFCNYSYHQYVDYPHEIYCCEVNIINKIKDNEEGYFDFDKNMIDIGSDIGTYSFILPFKHSYMFEGNNKKCIISSFNMLLHNKEDKFTLHNILLSDYDDIIKYNGFETELCDIDGFYENSKVIYDMQCTTLDSYNISNVSFIKIDVEGMEYRVLKGSIKTIINNNYPPILFELWPEGYYGMTQEKRQQLINFLTELGYTILWEWGQFDTHLAIHN